MPNVFKKLSSNANNLFTKIDKGASNFFLKQPLISVIKSVQIFKIWGIKWQESEDKQETFWKRIRQYKEMSQVQQQ